MSSIFTRIIERELPGTFLWRDDHCVAFLSINPLQPGHTLVVPREEIDHWIDCPATLRDHLFAVAQTIAKGIAVAFPSQKVGLMIAGLEVPHLHLHVVPINTVRDLDFANAATSLEPAALEVVAGTIREALTAQGATGVSD
ncbi:MAG: HIT family protein [Actinobacteria bacterium]|nr:HIT family protein [Actinomycetota bacterium]